MHSRKENFSRSYSFVVAKVNICERPHVCIFTSMLLMHGFVPRRPSALPSAAGDIVALPQNSDHAPGAGVAPRGSLFVQALGGT